LFHNAADLFDRKGPEIGALGQVLADESVGVLVEPTLPRMVGVGKVALCVEFFGDGLMIGELLAVVIGEGVNKVGMRPQCYEQGIRDGLSGLVGSLAMRDATCLALYSVSKTESPSFPTTVSASQSPMRERSSTTSATRRSRLGP
tara:strand:+ start:97 stop:531 length:435 start_codon:yes stop_codon:yes gene_type:complete